MRKFWSLTRVLLKDAGSSFNMKLGNKDRKWAGPLLWVLLGVCFLPLLFMVYTMFQGLYVVFAPAGQLSYITGLMLSVACLVVFIFSAFSAPAIFYFSREVEFLLPMPLTPEQITGAKFAVSMLFEYVIALFVMGPMYAVYIQYLPAASLTVNALITFLTLPVLPLVYSTTLVMLLMRISRFGRNRDMYNMIVGVIGVVLGLGIGMYSQRLNTIDPADMLSMIDGNQTSLGALRSLFPNNIFAAQAIADGNWFAQLLNILVVLAALAVFFLLARLLYFKGVIGISESSSPSKKMSNEEIQRGTRGRGVFGAYLQKELKLLFRSPTAFINCVMMVFMMPLMLVFVFALNLSDSGVDLSAFLTVDFNNPRVVAAIMAGAAAVGFFMAAMNLTTSTSISREGANYFIMKFLPVPYRTQLSAKAASGLVISLAGLVMLVIMLEIIFKAPVWIFLAVLLLMLPGTVFINYMGLLIDLFKPKLVWDNEQQAIKQSFNAMILMLAGMIIAAIIGIGGGLLLTTPLLAFVVLFLITSILAVAAYQFVLNMGDELMDKLSE